MTTTLAEAHRTLNAAKQHTRKIAKTSTAKRETFLEGLSEALENRDKEMGRKTKKALYLKALRNEEAQRRMHRAIKLATPAKSGACVAELDVPTNPMNPDEETKRVRSE